ncbi:MAG: 50S ribosomal protein L11 methyltransferase [Candidatus Marinimicrobia bacterium]|nr:50S ribosomal protein L11 methyltransferase [Candidatus Neomarinimicrobiota bacterium]MCF7840697.1 50S ribosomal protein L11 methyltransferase [Candidatus Neomarinimicrobiota bacterium]
MTMKQQQGKEPAVWQLVNVVIKPEWLELAADFAMGLGSSAVVETPSGFQVAFPGESADVAALGALKTYLTEVGAGAEVTSTPVVETDWNANWKAFFKPTPIGERLWVIPEWENPDVPPDAIVIRIRPAMAFGTGTHETTQLCMEFLENVIRGGESVLDIGAGSGILGITALKLGAQSVLGVEIDAVAAANFHENTELNGVSDGMILQITPEPQLAAPYEVGVANMIQSRLEDALPFYREAVKPGGTVIISGVLAEDDADFRAFLSKHLPWRIMAARTKNEWIGYQCIVES